MVSTDDGGICANRGALGHMSGRYGPVRGEGSWNEVVGERSGGTHEDVVSDGDSVEDADIVLYLAASTDLDFEVDEDVLAQDTVGTDGGVGSDL